MHNTFDIVEENQKAWLKSHRRQLIPFSMDGKGSAFADLCQKTYGKILEIVTMETTLEMDGYFFCINLFPFVDLYV